MEIKEYLDKIEKKLYNSFDIYRDHTVSGHEFDLFAEHHLRTEHYVLTRKTVIESIEANEYCFLKYFQRIEEKEVDSYTEILIDLIDEIIDLDHGHMSSIITGVIVVDNKPGDYIIEKIKKFKYHKGFKFGLKGWVDIRLILVTMNQNYIVANKKGREVLEVYRA